MRPIACLFATLLLSAGACATESPAAAGRAPAVVSATVRAAAAGQGETWAYVTLDNPGAADSIIAAHSPAAAQVVLRAVRVADAGRLARTVASIPLPAHGRLAMGADGWLLAFVRPTQDLRVGEQVQGTLRLASGRSVAVKFSVVEAAGDPGDAGN